MQSVWWAPILAPAVALADGAGRLRPGSASIARVAMILAGEAGDARRVERAARRTLEALVRSPRRLSSLLESGERANRPPERIEQGRALEALADLQARLATDGVQPFLIFGTLLGAIRDGSLIRGDWDLDLGVFGASRLALARRALARQGFRVSAVRRNNGELLRLSVRHPNRTTVDIKAFDLEPDGATAWSLNSGRIELRKRFPGHFRPRPMQFQGIAVTVPDCAEDFLEWQYGPGWRTPDPGYHVYTSGPLHGPEHRAFTRAAGPRVLLSTIRVGRGRKAVAMAQGLARLFPEDELWPRVVAALEECTRISGPARAEAGPAARGSAR